MRQVWAILGISAMLGGPQIAVALDGPPDALDETSRVALEGNTPPAALHASNDLGAVDDGLRLDHLLLVLKASAAREAALEKFIGDLHDARAEGYHRWLTPRQLGERFGVSQDDLAGIRRWLGSHGLTIDKIYSNSLVIDFSGSAGQIRDAFRTEIHELILPDGESHIANVADPEIPAALAPLIQGIASLHDFFPRARPVSAQPLWGQGVTGKGVRFAAVEDSNLPQSRDEHRSRETLGMTQSTHAALRQIDPGCANPGQNAHATEAAFDVEWASTTMPEAHIELAACANSRTTAGSNLAILGLLDGSPPDIIMDSHGLHGTAGNAAGLALENREGQLAAAEGVTLFMAAADSAAGPADGAMRP